MATGGGSSPVDSGIDVRRIAIGSDHAGYPLKQHLIGTLHGLAIEVDDLGTDSEEPVDYPPICAAVARAVATGAADRGIVLGGSGQGEQMAANKVRGIRCVEAADPVTARLGREHNDANVLSIGARIVGTEVARACVREFLASEFSAGRHVARIEKIARIEAEEAGH